MYLVQVTREQKDSGGVRTEVNESGDLVATIPRPERFRIPFKVILTLGFGAICTLGGYAFAAGKISAGYEQLQKDVAKNTLDISAMKKGIAPTQRLVFMLCLREYTEEVCLREANAAE